MSSREHRVTNCHRAAVCALILAGQGFVASCEVVGVPYRLLHRVLGDDWWRQGKNRQPNVWRGDRLLAVKSAYLDRSIPMKDIEVAYGITRRHIVSLAARYGWPRRPRGKGKPLPVPLAKMSDRDRNRFVKLSRVLGRDAAVQAVFG